jgi:uncharacterized membrane protein YccC
VQHYFRMHAWVSALKVVLSSIIGIFLIAEFDIDNGYALLLPMVIIPIVYHQSIEKNLIERCLGSFLGAILGIGLFIVTQNWLIYTAVIFFMMVFSMAYGTAKNIRYTMVWVFITLGLIYSTAHTGEASIQPLIVSWVENLWLGSFIYLLVDYSLLSQYPFRQLEKILEHTPGDQLNFREIHILLNISKHRVSDAALANIRGKVNQLEMQYSPKTAGMVQDKKPRSLTLQDCWDANKVVLAFLITIMTVSLLSLPGGFQIVVVAAVSATQPDLGRLQKKIFDRLIGLILGVSAAIFFILLLSQIPTLWCLSLIYAGWILITAYLGISRPDWFYFAVQAAVVVILIVALDTQAIAPTVDIMWERIIAICEGYLFSFTLMTLFKLKA